MFCIAIGGGFGNRLAGGNEDLECDYKIIEKFLRASQAQNKADGELQVK